MKLFGKIQELTQVLWRKNGNEVTLEPADATVGDATVTIPDPAGTNRTLVTTDQSQTLTNKTINADNNTVSNLETDNLKAGVLNTASDLAGATDTQIPSAAAVKTYVDDSVAGVNDAIEISYDNSTSGLTAEDVQAAIDEVEGRLDTAETNITTNATNLSDHEAEPANAHAASAITYAPSTLSNWNGSADPGQTDDALDQLAARLKTEETKVQPANLGGTGQTTYAEGDFLIGNGTATLDPLPIGDTGRFLLSNGTTASWTNTLTGGAISSENIAFADTKGIESSAASSTLNVGSLNNTDTLNLGNTTSTTNITGKATLDSVEYASTEVLLSGPTLAITNAHTTFRLKSGFGPDFDTISGATAGRQITVVNETTAPLTITNGTIITGTGADLVIEDGAAVTLLFDGTNWNLIGGAGGGGGLGTEVVNNLDSPVAVANNTHYLVDCSAGAVTLTLPTPPQPGSVVRASDESGTSATNNITFAGNGNLIDGDSSFIIDVDNGWAQLMWTGTEWTVDTLAVNDGAGLVSLNGLSGAAHPTQTFSSTDGSITFNSASGNHDIELADTIAGARTFSGAASFSSSLSMTSGADISLSDGSFILSSVSDAETIISGGNASNSGANIILYGATEVSNANVTVFRTSATERMRIDSSGNVGIGTGSPGADYKLHVSGTGTSVIQRVESTIASASITGLSLYGQNDADEFVLANRTVDDTFYIAHNPVNYTGAGIAAAAKLAITSAGAVTLGPSSGLTSAGHRIQAEIDNTTISNIGVQNAEIIVSNTRTNAAGERTAIRFDQGGIIKAMLAVKNEGGAVGSSFEFYTRDSGNVTRLGLIVGQTGAVTLGPSSGTFNVSHTAYTTSGTASGAFNVDTTATLSNAISNSVRVSSAGTNYSAIGAYTHAGITNLAGYLFLRTEDSALQYFWVDNADQFRISTNVNHVGTASGTVVGTQTSDERLKDNIQPLSYGLDKVLQLEPLEFDMDGVHKLGFGAQRTLPILPETVFDTDEKTFGEDEPSKLGMEYVQIVPVLVKAIQELAALRSGDADRIAALEAEIELIKNGGA